MSGFYVAWVTPEGEREHFPTVFAEDVARCLVEGLNGERAMNSEHAAIPAEQLEAWKAGA